MDLRKLLFGKKKSNSDNADDDWGELIRARMSETARLKAIDYKTNVANWIVSCIHDRGIPMFKTRYAKKRFDDIVLGICWDGVGVVKGQWFKNVPPEDLDLMEAGTGDWRWILRKYAPERVTKLTLEARRAWVEKRLPPSS